MYQNLGFAKGTLRFKPRQVSEGVVLLTLRIPGYRLDTNTGERHKVYYFPTFTLFGREAHKALQNLVEGQEVEIEYRIETRTKEVKGEKRFFEDKVITKITYGEKPKKEDDDDAAKAEEADGPQEEEKEEEPEEKSSPSSERKSVFNRLKAV